MSPKNLFFRDRIPPEYVFRSINCQYDIWRLHTSEVEKITRLSKRKIHITIANHLRIPRYNNKRISRKLRDECGKMKIHTLYSFKSNHCFDVVSMRKHIHRGDIRNTILRKFFMLSFLKNNIRCHYLCSIHISSLMTHIFPKHDCNITNECCWITRYINDFPSSESKYMRNST